MEPDDKIKAGVYEAMVIDASQDKSCVLIEFLVTTGELKGMILKIRASGEERDELDLLGLPAQIVVDESDGEPSVRWQ